MIMARFDNLDEGESSEANHILKDDLVSSKGKGKQHEGDEGVQNLNLQNTSQETKNWLEAPVFRGEDVEVWIQGMEMYFKVHSIPQNERLEFVMPHVEGPALQWFVWTTDRYVLEEWDDFKIQLGRRFSDLLSDDIMEQFLDIKQKGSVKEYRDEFERLSVYLPPISEAIMMKTFAKVLTKGIKAELSRESFKDLRELMDAAFKIEKIMQAVYESYHEQYLKEAKPPHPYTKTPGQAHPWWPMYKQACSTTYGKTAALPTTGRPQTEGDSTEVSSKGFIPNTKRKLLLTAEEFQNRREKGLCYHCNEKFRPGHHCKKTLQIMIVAEDEPKQNEREVSKIPVWEFSEEVSETQLLSAHVSLNSMLGLANTKSIMIKGALQGKEIMILVDSGASHSFLMLQSSE